MINVDQARSKWALKADILAHAKKLKDRTLRGAAFEEPVPEGLLDVLIGGRTRASFGDLVEKYYFGITPPNTSAPDFAEAGVELKTTPIKEVGGKYLAKERLVLNLINFVEEAALSFNESSFTRKNAVILLISYLHKRGMAVGDLPILVTELLEYENLPEEDKKIIREDWEKIHNKIVENRAHELSEGDTLYLGACTKAANAAVRTKQANGTEAKPRAYALKSSYMTALTQRYLGAKDETQSALSPAEVGAPQTFEEIVIKKFERFYGKEVGSIADELGAEVNFEAKGALATLARRVMGVEKAKVAEFEKADVQMKTVQVQANGMPREDMSFPAFSFADLVEEDWDADGSEEGSPQPEGAGIPASLKAILQKRFFFVVYRCADDCKNGDAKVLEKAFFWTIPNSDLEGDVRRAWDKAVRAIRSSRLADAPKISDDIIIHVRPHGQKGIDVDVLPDGTEETKQSFWLNKKYVRQIIESTPE